MTYYYNYYSVCCSYRGCCLPCVVLNHLTDVSFYYSENIPQEGAVFLKCARQVHLSAKDYYKKILTLNQLLCDDPLNLVKFYEAKAREIKCKSNMLKAFISTIKHVVPLLNNEIRNQLRISCPRG